MLLPRVLSLVNIHPGRYKLLWPVYVTSNWPPQFGLRADAYMCLPPKRFTSPFLCVLLKAADQQNSWGGPFIRRISSPQLSHVAAGSLPIYYHCKSPPPSLRPAPRLFKTYTKTFLKGLVRGPWCHGDGFNNLDFFFSRFRDPYQVFTHLCGALTEALLCEYLGQTDL